MNPLLDQFAVTAIICGAVAFFVVRILRKRAAGKSCDSGCGCSATKVGKPGPGEARKPAR